MFSEREEKIIRILRNRKLCIEEISKELFRKENIVPFDARITVNNSLRRIMKKCDHYELDWTFEKFKKDNKFFYYRRKVK